MLGKLGIFPDDDTAIRLNNALIDGADSHVELYLRRSKMGLKEAFFLCGVLRAI